MKNLLIAAILLFSTFSFAQVDWSSTRYGATIGGNFSRVKNAHNPSGPIYAFQAGGLALIPIDEDDTFYLQPEIVFYGAGETGKDKNAKGSAGYNAVYSNSYISVPIYLKGYFSEAESEFFGMFGPRFNFAIAQKVTDPSRPYYSIEGVDIPGKGNVNGKVSPFSFALGFGLGYSYKRKLEITGKFDYGLSNIYKGLNNEPGNDPNISKGKKEHVLSVGLNYIFD